MVREILSTFEIIVGMGGIVYSLAYLIPLNPVVGVVGFVTSICVTILGLDEGAEADKEKKENEK